MEAAQLGGLGRGAPLSIAGCELAISSPWDWPAMQPPWKLVDLSNRHSSSWSEVTANSGIAVDSIFPWALRD